MTQEQETCCPPFNPEAWDNKEITWEGRKFVKDRVRSFLHIPLNFAGVMIRNTEKLTKAGAMPAEEEFIVLSDENSLWGADIYLSATKEVADAEMATLSGTFACRVFEGPYKNAPKWAREMQKHVMSSGRKVKKLYFYYTTCPKCAEKYGKNYVVLLAELVTE